MTSLIKKATMLAVAVIVTTSVSAQAPMGVGIYGTYGTGDNISNFGIGAKFRYGITEALRGEAQYSYFFKEKTTTMWEANINAHYLVPVGSSALTVYPLAGVSLFGVSNSGTSDDTFGFNVGAGFDYALSSTLTLNAEAKYRIGKIVDVRGVDGGRPMFQVGLVYNF